MAATLDVNRREPNENPIIASNAPGEEESAMLGSPCPTTRDRGDLSYPRSRVPLRPAGEAR